jgi:hypothetical protein
MRTRLREERVDGIRELVTTWDGTLLAAARFERQVAVIDLEQHALIAQFDTVMDALRRKDRGRSDGQRHAHLGRVARPIGGGLRALQPASVELAA